jgi:transcriptional antiterminator RfaH
MMKSWFAVHTHAHGEQRALINLERQGFESWLPLYHRTRRHAGKVERVLRPLFPRYLFVSIDLEAQRWRAILSTYGVAGLVGLSDGPVPVPDSVIDSLRARAGEDGHYVLDGISRLKTGDPVRVEAGPMRDLEGVFQAASDDERVIILLNMMGRGVRVTVSADHIERA